VLLRGDAVSSYMQACPMTLMPDVCSIHRPVLTAATHYLEQDRRTVAPMLLKIVSGCCENRTVDAHIRQERYHKQQDKQNQRKDVCLCVSHSSSSNSISPAVVFLLHGLPSTATALHAAWLATAT